ncbi:transglycosylase domain-containing protein [Cryobacterium sp. BB736]|uniref:transglycosylase domain-containing protein n=1 Tax=Cryobacterium sp. BB736 TaxID=2746963 RepID=UPI001874C9C9|nr:transglycosylase domain-containing protein [Cryobacterium sp. BB736]
MPSENSKLPGALKGFLGMVGLSGLAGVLITALVTPALAVTSMTANSSIGIFEALPDYIEIGDQSVKNTLYGVSGGEYVPFATMYKQNREELGWDQVSEFIKQAVVAGEDRRFWEHGGVDMQSIARAAVGNAVSGDIDSGASTLTMQLVKNINMQEAVRITDPEERKAALQKAQEQSLERKLREAKLAIGLEKTYSKEDIMLAYLNIAGFGNNTYGIEAASKQYFSKPAADVTLAEAASLIAIVQYPNARNLDSPEKYQANKNRRDDILKIMLELDMITKAQHDEAVATPIESYVNISAPASGCMYASYSAQNFCDYVSFVVPELESLGADPKERQANWDRGGYDVYTTINLDQQVAAKAITDEQAPASESRFSLGAAVSAVEPGTGKIRVMAQNKHFDNSQEGGGPETTAVNFNTDRPYGGSSGFQVGSTYKIITLAAWLKAGHGLQEVVDGTNAKVFKRFPSCEGDWVGNQKFHNFANQSFGRITVQQATNSSVNTAYLSMAQQLNLCDIRDTGLDMGVHRADEAKLQANPSAVIGTNEIAPISIATMIATIAAGGKSCDPIAVEKIVDRDGAELAGQAPKCRQALSPEVAAGAAHALQQVMSRGTGAVANPFVGIPLVGKTGTSDNAEHTWMVAASTNIALTVWVGNIMDHADLSRIAFGGGNGASARHRIFKPVMANLLGLYGGNGFPDAPGNLITGTTTVLPDFSGQSVATVKSALEGLGFEYTDGGTVASALPAGVVASTDPPAGSRLSPGFSVTVYVSDGSLAGTVPNVVGMTEGEARAALAAEGLTKVKVDKVDTTDPSQVDRVISTSPGAGTGVSKSDTVTITVGRAPRGGPTPGPDPDDD